ncbi:MAG: PSD1 domain-containing protein [Acidobacteria bacterium]|nr:PSD1 domain-containing protein [Acidobacteriota bacterium]
MPMKILPAIACSGILWAQQKPPAPRPDQQVMAILSVSCASCHNAQKADGKLRLDSLAMLARGGASGPAVAPGRSAESKLVERLVIADAALRMPPGAVPLEESKIRILRNWIDQGAKGLPALQTAVDFDQHIEPILKANCYACHSGPQPKSQLRLDAGASALKGGLGGTVIVPGNSAASRMIHRLEGRGGEKQMPLDGKPLPAEQMAILKRWIDSGAKWPAAKMQAADAGVEKHWAYKKPVRAPIPHVKNSALVRNPIDAFLLARLEKQGLSFSPEASKETLIRRVSLDLTGLPPAPQEVAEFVADARPDAYARLVGRLLASPHYGERWARPWLDLARYADTNGYEKDRRRTMWTYRDWVIQALNKDMPFDQFTIEQIAGDMLPDATTGQKIATGFHRNTMYNEEGGVDKEEAHFEVLVDRVNTTAAVWLGTTIGCSQCHNHKYDPFTQRDYYSLMAFFNNVRKEVQQYGDTSTKFVEPQIDLATPEQEARRTKLTTRIRELDQKLKTTTPELEAEQAAWERKVLAAGRDWQTLAPLKAAAPGGTTLAAATDGALLASGENPQRETYVIESRTNLRELTGLRIEALPHASLPRGGPGRDLYGNCILSAVDVEVARPGGRWEKLSFKRLLADDGRVNDNRNRQLWTVDASRDEKRMPRQLVLVLRTPVQLDSETPVRITIAQNSDFVGQSMGHFRLSVTGAADPSLVVKVRAKLRPALESANRTAEHKKEMAEFYRTISPSLEPARDELKELRSQLDRLNVVTALVMNERPSFDRPYDFIRTRGAFSAKADKVYANVPASLNPLPENAMPNRLGLAQWLVSKDNPLTARVAVNRIWEQYFGRGIVETPEDFGSQGERPNHPELLDWLAAGFLEKGWSMKAVHRLIVTSAAYRQTSRITPELLQADPYNRLISRGPRFRMEAEMVRDSVLASSGLLSRKIGGPSVFPPQPPGVWDVPYSDDQWEESAGEDRRRRGLYTFVRRSAMYPAMMNFDATSREVCTVRRIRTNTPLQALTTLNDPAFFEAAQALAARMVKEGGAGERERAEYGWRLVTAHAPKPGELDRILSWRHGEAAYFRAHPDEAKKLAADEDMAAWTMLANVLLNLDEALTKE